MKLTRTLKYANLALALYCFAFLQPLTAGWFSSKQPQKQLPATLPKTDSAQKALVLGLGSIIIGGITYKYLNTQATKRKKIWLKWDGKPILIKVVKKYQRQ